MVYDHISYKISNINYISKRVDRVPSYVAKSRWFDVTTELTRYTYNMRESMNRYLSTGVVNYSSLTMLP